MKVKFNDDQCKACLLSVRCFVAATAALLHQDPLGKTIMDRATALLHRIGPDGDALADADLDREESNTLVSALNAAHFILVLSKDVAMSMPDDERQATLKNIRHCMATFK